MAGKKIITWIILMLIAGHGLIAQTKITRVSEVPENFCLSSDEWKLFLMINEYRKQYDLPPIPLSRSLCYVANTHAKDLFFHHPDIESCNFHSWSDKGPWKPFCYPADEDKKNSVWDKPKELSDYPGKGFEIVYWENSDVVIDSVINFWRSFDYFNSFLMNTGKWKDREWKAIGIGICQNYAVAWFGEERDTTRTPSVCGQKPPDKQPDTVPIKTQTPVVSILPEVSTKSQPSVQSATDHYYIIVKSLLPILEAEKVVEQLKSNQYNQARIIQNGGKIRVSLFDTSDRDEALRLLKEAKKLYKDAWLYKQ